MIPKNKSTWIILIFSNNKCVEVEKDFGSMSLQSAGKYKSATYVNALYLSERIHSYLVALPPELIYPLRNMHSFLLMWPQSINIAIKLAESV